jgi:hypothetical protein
VLFPQADKEEEITEDDTEDNEPPSLKDIQKAWSDLRNLVIRRSSTMLLSLVPDFDHILRKEIQENAPSVQTSISSYFQPVRHIETVKSSLSLPDEFLPVIRLETETGASNPDEFQPVCRLETVTSNPDESEISASVAENGSTDVADPNFKCGNCDRSFFDKCNECSNAYCEACLDHHGCLGFDYN